MVEVGAGLRGRLDRHRGRPVDGNAWPVWAVALVVAVQGVLVPRGASRERRTGRRLLAELGAARAV